MSSFDNDPKEEQRRKQAAERAAALRKCHLRPEAELNSLSSAEVKSLPRELLPNIVLEGSRVRLVTDHAVEGVVRSVEGDTAQVEWRPGSISHHDSRELEVIG